MLNTILTQQDMISNKRIIMCIVFLLPLYVVAQTPLPLQPVHHEYWLCEIELDQKLMQRLDSIYFKKIIEFGKPLAWCTESYEQYPYISIYTKEEGQGKIIKILFHNNYIVSVRNEVPPKYYFEHRGYYCVLMDDGLKEWVRKTTGKNWKLVYDEDIITDDTEDTYVEYDRELQTFRMINFAYQPSTCYDDNPNPITHDRKLNSDEKKEILHYLKSQNIDFSNYLVGLFCTIVVNEDGNASPYRLWIPTSSSADQWEEISRTLLSFKWKRYYDDEGIPHRYEVNFKYSHSELNADNN